MLPVKINASSHNGYSYFYAVSPSKSVLLKIIGYLYAGLQQMEYAGDDIKRERDGVIARELAMYEATQGYQSQMSIWRGDRAPDCYHHWGGYCDTLAQICTDDVTAYKSQYYQPEHITLLLAGVEADELPLLCTTKGKSGEQTYEPKQHRFFSDTLQDDYIFSWWLPECYIDGLLSAQERLSQSMQRFGMRVFIEDSPNHQQKFALRLIGRPGQLMAAQQALIDQARQLHIVPKQHLFFESKYPETINALLAWYHGQQPLNRKVVALSQALALTPVITGARPLKKPVIRIMDRKTEVETTCPLVSDTLENHTPQVPTELPGRLNPLALLLDDKEHFACDLQDWIYQYSLAGMTPEQQNTLITGVMCDERLWLPRTAGHCYAMGVQRVENGLRIYGVMDDEPHQRREAINQLLALYRHA
ncbi:hypothetical protein GCM10011338_13430 [Alteromonas lipolytica]|nr:hypothetical protein GCM10011338_13430 [Alteromonas lipolytica]